jgi:hypothetical protein
VTAVQIQDNQDAKGAFTLDGAQCVFEGFNTFERITGGPSYHHFLVKAADRMIGGTLAIDGSLLLPDIIEVGEYAHFAFMACYACHADYTIYGPLNDKLQGINRIYMQYLRDTS